MRNFKSLEVDIWSSPNDQHRVKHIGMANSAETFEKLKSHLQDQNMLPDDYFLFNDDLLTRFAGKLPDYHFAECLPNYGGSEGIYLDITLLYSDESGHTKRTNFLTGKTLEESSDAFIRMARIAAECSLMLNGRGCSYIQNDIELTLKPDEADMLHQLLKRALDAQESEAEITILSAIIKKLDR